MAMFPSGDEEKKKPEKSTVKRYEPDKYTTATATNEELASAVDYRVGHQQGVSGKASRKEMRDATTKGRTAGKTQYFNDGGGYFIVTPGGEREDINREDIPDGASVVNRKTMKVGKHHNRQGERPKTVYP